MALTLGSYGFTYAGAIARGFALAQALNLLGIWLLLRAPNAGWALAAGTALGSACWANYLAAFIATAALAWAIWARGRIGLAALAGFLGMLALPLWFFLAQRASRTGQFPPFELLPALSRLARYGAANLFGGLPLYAGPARATVGVAVAALLAILGILLAQRWRRIEQRWLLILCTVAPALGLLGLSLVFNNTPIELRYLAFATPFTALLLAGALASRPAISALVLTVQAAAIAGLLLRPETMQPQTATTQAAAALAGPNGLVLLPRGNDGVGLVGSVLLSAPTDLRLALVRPTDSPAHLQGLAPDYPRLVLALLAVDGESRATLPLLPAAFTANECWREIPAPANLRTYDNLCRG